MNDIKRGEIFYISRGGESYGSEQQADRPAVIVSNDRNNENSTTVEVVYLTTQPKAELPTHTVIHSTGRISTVLCEQVHTVSMNRIGNYIGQCSDKEMENIDIALMISLSLDAGTKTSKKWQEEQKRQQEEIESLKVENETLKAEKGENEACGASEGKTVTAVNQSIVRIEAERDIYRELYESLLEKTMAS